MSQSRPEYPRPILVRPQWKNLNGQWLFKPDPDDAGLASRWFEGIGDAAEKISVPYPVESEASGIHQTSPDDVVWYEREFEVPVSWTGRIILRIGACDHWTRVFINGIEAGQHRGGYSPIGVDVTHVLLPGQNRVTIRVEDSLSWTQPRGKQAGTTRWPIDYDSVTGIWQTVWLEPLPSGFIESTQNDFQYETGNLNYTVHFSGHLEGQLTVSLMLDGEMVDEQTVDVDYRAEARTSFKIENPALWSPDSPVLYDVKLTLENKSNGEMDTAESYLGLRTVSVENGNLLLNGKQIYLRGVLDQGYFPKGWYTALSDEDLRRDVELTLAMGFNCARKHQKVEDPRYLYWADKLGLLVWAEMPSGKIFSSELVETLTSEWISLVKRDRAHPSIISWVPFNESWGVWHQAERPEQRAFVDATVQLTKSLDQSRLVVGNDGWEYSSGDLWTLHLYDSEQDLVTRLDDLMANPQAPVVSGDSGMRVRVGALPGSDVSGLPVLLTECGGVGFGVYSEQDFSYGALPQTEQALEQQVSVIAGKVHEASMLQGFVWTQLTDVQQEVNGLLYFDRTPKLPLATYRRIFSGVGTGENR